MVRIVICESNQGYLKEIQYILENIRGDFKKRILMDGCGNSSTVIKKIEKVEKSLLKTQDKIFSVNFIKINDLEGEHFIDVEDIVFISADRKYIYINTSDNKKYKVEGKLDVYEKLLEKYKVFVRVHKLYIVNFSYVKRYENEKVYIESNYEIDISKKLRNEVRERYMELKIDDN